MAQTKEVRNRLSLCKQHKAIMLLLKDLLVLGLVVAIGATPLRVDLSGVNIRMCAIQVLKPYPTLTVSSANLYRISPQRICQF